MKIETWSIDKLKENPKNARGIKKEDFERLKKHIKKHGIYKPLIVNEEGLVIGGNMRLKAYKELGITEVEVSIVDAKTEPEILALGLSDNDRAGYYEEQDLAELIQEYGLEIGLEDYKVDLGQALSLIDILNQFAPEVKEDEVPPISEGESDSKLGEIYQLGRHRLMCGDATKIEDVEKLMNGQKADMVFTDPPYGIDLNTDWSDLKNDLEFIKKAGITNNSLRRGSKYPKIIGDKNNFNAKFIFDLFNIEEIFLWGANYYIETLPNYGKNGSWFVWDKRIDESSDKSIIGSSFELLWSKNKHRQQIIRQKWFGVFGLPSQDIHKRIHPTQKPIQVYTFILKQYSKQDDIVLDLFGGSGSTLIACEQLNRICYMMEIDPKYCDVIRKRFDNYINLK